jgi:hypothetical protein
MALIKKPIEFLEDNISMTLLMKRLSAGEIKQILTAMEEYATQERNREREWPEAHVCGVLHT